MRIHTDVLTRAEIERLRADRPSVTEWPPLDPKPWECAPLWGGTPLRHAQVHEGYVYWAPREGYEQDEDKYPEEVFEEE